MAIRFLPALVVAAFVAVGCEGAQQREAAQQQAAPPTVVLETTHGRIVMELEPERAPITVRNFLAHVRAGFYDSVIFHRVKPGFTIQAGYYRPDMRRVRSSAAPIMNESDNGLKNVRGAVAMARTDYPHSANTQFFINLVDNPGLDYDSATNKWGYAVFGHVVEGMDVVDAIAAVATRRRGSDQAVPVEPIVILRAFLKDEGR